MLNVLFVYSALSVDCVDGKYYNNALNSFIERYKPLGNLMVCVSRKECGRSSQSYVDLEGVSIRFIEKENTIKKRFINRPQHKRTINELVSWADLVIGHVPDSVAIMALECAMYLGKTCMAVAVGCPWDAYWNHSSRGKCMAPVGFLSMRRVMKKVPYAMYVTQEFLQRRYPCPGETIGCSNVVMPPLDMNALTRRLDKIKGVTGRTLKLATSAAVNVRYKGQCDVIKAMRLLRKRGINIQYYLLGGGDNAYLHGVAEKNGEVRTCISSGWFPMRKCSRYLTTWTFTSSRAARRVCRAQWWRPWAGLCPQWARSPAVFPNSCRLSAYTPRATCAHWPE